ncbi:MAG: patatin-like phospholipase family protein [Bacteroidota bacterium]
MTKKLLSKQSRLAYKTSDYPTIRLLTLSILFLLVQNSFAQTDRPSLGLALGGGGAKGLAHIGVLQVFEEAGIYPDVVSGTSMGSIIGGLYAIGYAPDQLLAEVKDIDWPLYFSDSYPSSLIPIEERRRSSRYQLSIPLQNGKISIPQGLLQGRKIQTLLGTLTIPGHGKSHFDDYFRPFRAVATDIVTGKAHVFDDGLPHHAIRASMSIPSVFAPVTSVEDSLLVDGLVVRNLPVSDLFSMGAKVAIAVDVALPLYRRDELTSPVAIMSQTAGFGSAILNEKQRDSAHIILDPILDPYTTFDYGFSDSIIARGVVSAQKALPRIRRQLDSLGIQLPMKRPERPNLELDSFFVTRVHYESDTETGVRIMKKLMRLRAPNEITKAQITQQIGQLYGSGFFDWVDFKLIPNSSGYDLFFTARTAPDWRLRLSAAYDTDFEPALLTNLTGRNVIGRGSVLALDARISEFPRATIEYLLYNQTRPSIGIRLQASANFYPGRVYQNNELIDEYRTQHYTARLSAFSALGSSRYL